MKPFNSAVGETRSRWYEMRSRGQAAMEFLMTYGWAVVVMLVVIAVLFYLGIFSPSTTAPDVCVLPAGFSCHGFQVVDGGDFTLDLGQATGRPILVERIACSANENPTNWEDFDYRLKSGRNYMFTGITCFKEDDSDTPEAGDYYNGFIFIDYTEEGTNIRHRIKGDIAYKVEEGLAP
jgi:hypothetical protein